MRLRVLAFAAVVAVLSAAFAVPAEAAQRRMTVAVTDVAVTAAGPDQIRVSWRGGGQTTKYAIIAGSDSMTMQNHFQTPWIPAKDARIRARSIVVTVPVALRAVLGGGSGDYVFAKVVQTNSLGTPPICRQWTPATYCRASASGSASLAGTTAPTVATFPISIASWNVQSVTATLSLPVALQWRSRLSKVLAAIQAASPDVIGTQESTTARVDPSCLNRQGIQTVTPCTEQYMSIANGLAPDYATAGPDAWQWVYKQYAKHANDPVYTNYVDSAIYYKPTVVTELDHGFISPYDQLHIPSMRIGDEAGIWALFADNATGSRFIMVSMHMPVGDQYETVRRDETAALASWLTAKAAAEGGVPVVLTADLNSYAGADPLPAVTPLRAAGFSDAASTPNRTGARWSSTNESNSSAEDLVGYPTVAVQHAYPTNRIDYVLTYVAGQPSTTSWATSYANVVHLNAAGTAFDPTYQGSDHDMQLAALHLPIGNPDE